MSSALSSWGQSGRAQKHYMRLPSCGLTALVGGGAGDWFFVDCVIRSGGPGGLIPS